MYNHHNHNHLRETEEIKDSKGNIIYRVTSELEQKSPRCCYCGVKLILKEINVGKCLGCSAEERERKSLKTMRAKVKDKTRDKELVTDDAKMINYK